MLAISGLILETRNPKPVLNPSSPFFFLLHRSSSSTALNGHLELGISPTECHRPNPTTGGHFLAVDDFITGHMVAKSRRKNKKNHRFHLKNTKKPWPAVVFPPCKAPPVDHRSTTIPGNLMPITGEPK